MKAAANPPPEKPGNAVAAEQSSAAQPPPFPIVGIGASAGGLEVLEQFLEQVPADSGMAFVIVQHLDPTHKALLPELLQRVTTMHVVQVRERTRVRPDRVYVIPPNKDMSIRQGVLHLQAPAAARGLRLPIDFFLRSLAEDRQEHSIGVILSGMGSDGTLGLRAIKEQAGVALVQDPDTAEFDSMPRSAIEAGLADVVAPPDALAAKISAYLQRTPLVAPSAAKPQEDQAQGTLAKVVALLRTRCGHDFSLYKHNTILRRIERRMGLHQINQMPAYLHFLQDNPQELDLLFKELLIGVTRFFRDPAAWELLREQALPALLASRPSGQATLRAWVPGCSTGEEAYSLAMVFKEAAEAVSPDNRRTLQIFATDLDRDAIAKARQGFFPANSAGDVSTQRLDRFFTQEDRGYRLRKEIREMVIFAPQDLIMDPPFTRLDILSCRNLLIYLTAQVQKKLISLFHYSLTPGGLLFLGSAETIGSPQGLFAPLSAKARIFQKTASTPDAAAVEFPSSFSAAPATGGEARPATKLSANLQSAADQLILTQYAPPAVLANDKGDILYICGRTGKYLEPAAGKANWNVFAMAREGLRYELSRAFQKVLRQQQHKAVTIPGIKLADQDDGNRVTLTAERLDASGPLQGMVMLVFADVAAPAVAPPNDHRSSVEVKGANLAELEQELVRCRDEARSMQADMQTSQEELRSANEELQSTNEELTTSKEEMQSMNEELQTVNAELQAKVDELSCASSDIKNLLDSTDIATLFLDKQLNVRRFTALVTRIIKLIPGDVGRPITDLTSELRYPDLAQDAREVLRTLAASEKQIATDDKRWFTVRIMPYRTLDDRIDGVVITFLDITDAKMLEAQLRSRQSELEDNVATHDTPPNRSS